MKGKSHLSTAFVAYSFLSPLKMNGSVKEGGRTALQTQGWMVEGLG